MRILRVTLALLIISFNFFVGTVNAADTEEIYTGIKSLSLSLGEEAEFPIILNHAPNGLAGYYILLEIENENIATIIDVKYPNWAILNDSIFNDGSVLLKGIDLENEIKEESGNIELATIVLKAIKEGETDIKLKVIRMTDDFGNLMTPSTKQSRILVLSNNSTVTPLVTPKTTPGFEVIFTIVGIITTLYLLRRVKF